MHNTLFTIAIPTYNNANIIKKAIESALHQKTDINYEVMIVNNASSDATLEVISQFNDKKIRIVNNPQTVTLLENHNICLKEAKGRYIIFCHSDDALEPNAIQLCNKKVQERGYPDKYVLWGNSMFRDFSINYINKTNFNYNQIVVGEFAPLGMMYGGLAPSGTLYSRESLLEIGGFIDTTKPGPFDFTSMIYMAMKGFRFEMTDEMLLWRVGASTSPSEAAKSREEVDDAFRHFFKKVSDEEITKLINLSTNLKDKPWILYYTLLQKKEHKKQIKRIITLELIKNPLLLRKVIVRKTISRI
jgi:glycosyltransferase involved in cell wall biosynthesis